MNIIYLAVLRFLELLNAPFRNSDILWTVVPLVIATLIMFIYFQRYKEEELGWNSAVANSLISLFVSISLLRHLYFISGDGNIINLTGNLSRTVISLLLLFWGLLLLIINFKHSLPKKVAYFLSSPLTINLISYVAIVFVYSSMPFDFLTFLVIVIFFSTVRIILYLVGFPLSNLFKYMKKLKDKEVIEDIHKEKKKITKEKRELKKQEKKIKIARVKQVKETKKQLTKIGKALKKK